MICPYCSSNATLQDNKRIYGKSLGRSYICDKYPACDSYVGVHRSTGVPVGTIANKELRVWRMLAHKAFDKLWVSHSKRKKGKNKNGKRWKPDTKQSTDRSSAYKWLASKMRLDISDCHIGMFTVEQCGRVVELCKDKQRIGE